MGPKHSNKTAPQSSTSSSSSSITSSTINNNNNNSTISSTRRLRCPFCKIIIEQQGSEFRAHFDRCQKIKKNKESVSTLYAKAQESEVDNNLDTLNLIQALENSIQDLEKKNQRFLTKSSMENQFDDKIEAFRAQLRKMKKDWTIGAETIEIERDNILNQSIIQFNKIDPHKELKIAFKGEVNYDAGGLIREWLSVLFKIFFDEKSNLFEKADTENISFLIKKGIMKTQYNTSVFIFIGQLIGKALLENLTINCCFNKLIYKLLLDEKIELEDMIFIDKSLYHSLKEIKKSDNIEDLELYYSIQYETDKGEIKTAELVNGGDDIKVKNDNVNDYIMLRIGYLANTQRTFIDLIKTGINKIISNNMLKQLTSDELELVLNGTPFIDLLDWKENTKYQDYIETDFVIVEFWRILGTLSQDNLSHILQFCTGSARVPIGGFSSLESNRGNVAPFCITKAPYNANSKNFIRAHTCFNRLDIPNYPNKTLLQNGIMFILKNEALGFGID